jgi:hypothetical protein
MAMVVSMLEQRRRPRCIRRRPPRREASCADDATLGEIEAEHDLTEREKIPPALVGSVDRKVLHRV